MRLARTPSLFIQSDSDEVLGPHKYPEVRAYVGHLPQTVKHKIKGKTIVIESPHEFEEWLGSNGNGRQRWPARLMARIRGN